MSAVTEAPPTPKRTDDAGGVRGLLWLTYRQHRWTLLGALVVTAVLVGVMTYLALELTDLWHQCNDTYCPENSPQGVRLAGTSPLVYTMAAVSRLVQYMPMLIGVFIGVPVLAREHEQRTLLLAWSQDVSPARWLWTKLGLLGLFVAAVTAAVAGVSDYLERMQTRVAPGSLFDYLPFLNTAMLPVVTSLCWFAIGVALGAAVKRTLPAVFGVMAGFVGLTYLVQWRYPTLMAPLSTDIQLGRPDRNLMGDNVLVVNGGIVEYGIDGPSGAYDASGRELTGTELERLCPSDNDWSKMLSCYTDHQLEQHVLYQPGSRIPEFHLVVASGYVGLAAVAVVVTWLLVRRTNLSAG